MADQATTTAAVTEDKAAAAKPAVSPQIAALGRVVTPRPQDGLVHLFRWLRENNGSVHYQKDQNLYVLQTARHQSVSISAQMVTDAPETLYDILRAAFASL